MLIYLIIQALLSVFLVILTFVPLATSLPFGIDGALYTVGQWIIQVQQYIWPLQIVFTIFFKVYLPFLLALMVLKFFLGHRAPGRDMS